MCLPLDPTSPSGIKIYYVYWTAAFANIFLRLSNAQLKTLSRVPGNANRPRQGFFRAVDSHPPLYLFALSKRSLLLIVSTIFFVYRTLQQTENGLLLNSGREPGAARCFPDITSQWSTLTMLYPASYGHDRMTPG
jgi:hypothetical protein